MRALRKNLQVFWPTLIQEKKSIEYVESRSLKAEKYDILLHFASALRKCTYALCGQCPQAVTAFLQAQRTGFVG